ncbi:hypothetical protein H7J07_02225 [Mycobacterium koreense]|uniref:Uncharacterized protein n=1 Tax=Mycolicibacillus koreensis TaxID=1069220 RepID=A0A7I7SGC0_9MYCO|nr:hypothetical protein [Mycolicibacillus koreensis]MCV7247076.1 hypothetical protein [Mycolicibacillus koreensis]ODR09900.1 hypothetical protein BHQ15_06405 [Mycolicibacillus koreensis]OSC31896.1 hypothetical protein B8W67_15555 [Mycolicibacillus koreensis]BBY55974.1 hypothetical protein MKOR_32250 [Mycolicibacillus koreensis]
MDIPLHPALVAELDRGAAFLDQVRNARKAIVDTRITIPFPDGEGGVEFSGDGMVVDADFPDDLIDRYPGEDLAEVLTAICQEAYAQLTRHAAAVTATVLPDDGGEPW